MDTLALLVAQNKREVWLLETGDEVQAVPPGTPGALRFVLVRVPARTIRQDLIYAALGRDGYVSYANWCNTQAQRAKDQAEASQRKPGAPQPFDDTPPDDAQWRAHTLALETAVEEALLSVGLEYPKFEEVQGALGLYQSVLVRELVQWGRQVPAWTPKDADTSNSSSGPSVPP